MSKLNIEKIEKPGQASSNILLILIFKISGEFKNLKAFIMDKPTKNLENKVDIREFLLNNIFELTDAAFEKVLTSVKHLFDEDEIKLFNTIRRIPEFNIANMKNINAAHDAGFLVYRNDYLATNGKEATLKVTPNTEDYAEARQRTIFLGTQYIELIRNTDGKIVDFVIQLKDGVRASDAIQWIINDRDQIKFFDCTNSITLTF